MKIPYFKAKSLSGIEVQGFYVECPETTYAFKEDYDKNPVKLIPHIVGYRMTDWCLPNQLTVVRIDRDTLEQVGFVDTDVEYFNQGDWVKEIEIGGR